MKLRLRSLDSKETLKLEVPNTSTVRELKEILSSRLSSGDSSSSIHPDQFFLTLNRSDELSGSSLQSVGVTSGDLIFYSFSPNYVASSSYTVNPQNQIDSIGELVEPKKFADDDCKIGELVDTPEETQDLATSLKRPNAPEGEGNSGGEIVSLEDMEVDYDDGDIAYLSLLSVPSFLKKVFEDEIGSSSSSNGSDTILVKIAVHAVLLESGFVGYDPISFTKIDGFHLPDKFPSSPLHYTIPEVLSFKGAQSVAIKFQNLGKFVNVNGSLTVPNKFISRVSLDVSRFAPAFNLVWKNRNDEGDLMLKYPESDVFEFWKHVKDGIALPLLINLCESVGITPPSCFMLLHTDLKLKILELLPGTDIAKVACVCTELRFISSYNELWSQKYEQEFGNGNAVENVGADGWKLMYSRAIMRRKMETELVRRRRIPVFPGGFVIPHYPFPGQDPSFPAPFGGPRIIGGNDDIYGVPRIFPYPFGRQRRMPKHPNCNLGGFNP